MSKEREIDMQTTVNIDPDQFKLARRLTGINDVCDLVNESLRALIERESARRLVDLGGTMPNLKDVPRRRPWTDGVD